MDRWEEEGGRFEMELLTECSRREVGWLLDGRDVCEEGSRGFVLERVVREGGSGSIVGRRAILVMVMESEEGGSLGYSKGNVLPIKIDLGTVLSERFCVKKNRGFLPTMYTTVVYSSGFRAVSRTVRSSDAKTTSVFVVLDQDSAEAFRVIVQEKADCKFCSLCDVVCECEKESQLSVAEGQFASSGSSDVPAWDVYCNILAGATDTTFTSEVFVCGRFFPGSFREKVRQRESFYFNAAVTPRPLPAAHPKGPHDLSPSSLLTNNDPEESAWLFNEATSAENGGSKPQGPSGEGTMRYGHYKNETVCRRCNASFTRNADLIRHVQGVHEAIRKYRCNKCSRSFTQNAHLKGHAKSVHDKVRDWSCDVCDKRFSTKFQLERHQKSIHGIVRPNPPESSRKDVKRRMNPQNLNLPISKHQTIHSSLASLPYPSTTNKLPLMERNTTLPSLPPKPEEHLLYSVMDGTGTR